MRKLALADEFVQVWASALGVDPSETRRVVIDASVGAVVKVYVEKYGTEAVLQIAPPSGDLDVTVVGQ